MEHMLEQINEILAEYTEITAGRDSALIDDLGLDSFLIVYFLTEVEDAFDIDIDESEFPYIITIKDVIEQIQKGLSKKTPH